LQILRVEVSSKEFDKMSPGARVAFLAVGRALYAALNTCRLHNLAFPPVSKDWVDPRNDLSAEDYSAAMRIWAPRLLQPETAIADDTEEPWLRYIPHYPKPDVSTDVYFNELTNTEIGLEDLLLGEGSFARVEAAGIYAIKYIRVDEMSPYSIELHIIGDFLAADVPEGVCVEPVAASSMTDCLIVRTTFIHPRFSMRLVWAYSLLFASQFAYRRLGRPLAAFLQGKDTDFLGHAVERKSNGMKIIAVNSLNSLLKLFKAGVLLKFVSLS
jgi:hypothetical protein